MAEDVTLPSRDCVRSVPAYGWKGSVSFHGLTSFLTPLIYAPPRLHRHDSVEGQEHRATVAGASSARSAARLPVASWHCFKRGTRLGTAEPGFQFHCLRYLRC